MGEFNITKFCGNCDGDGIVQIGVGAIDPETGEILPPVDVPCSACIEGKRLIYTLNRSTNVFESYEILEELDATEYNALTDRQKDGVLHILACGLVDLNDGKAGKVRLWNWFGSESTTVANLTALLT